MIPCYLHAFQVTAPFFCIKNNLELMWETKILLRHDHLVLIILSKREQKYSREHKFVLLLDRLSLEKI